jgi:hypothetical protein
MEDGGLEGELDDCIVGMIDGNRLGTDDPGDVGVLLK